MRTKENNRRAAPIIALLVIILGIGTIFFLPALFINSPRVETPANDILINASSTPFTTENEYNFHRGRGELAVALYQIEAQAASQGWTAQDNIRAGNLWRDMGDLNRALPYWEAANTQESNPNLLRQIAEIYIRRGDWGLAWERIQVLLELAPNDVWALYYGGLLIAPSDPQTAYPYLARISSSEGELAETAQALSELIGTDPNNPQIVLQVGAILAGVEEWSLAENAYQYAADWYYPFPEASAYVGLMRAQQGKNGDIWINEALALAPDNALVQYVAGIYWRSVSEFVKSEDALILAVILDPANPTFYAELGITYALMGNRIDAETWLQTAVLIAPEDANIQAALDNFYEEETLLVTSPLLQFSQADIGTNEPAVMSANGWALHITGNSEAGLALVESALALEPENPRALFDKARILLETGHEEEAQVILEQLAVGDSPFAPIATRMLEN